MKSGKHHLSHTLLFGTLTILVAAIVKGIMSRNCGCGHGSTCHTEAPAKPTPEPQSIGVP